MATSVEFIEFVCDQIKGPWDIRYRKMFGEYMVYVNDKPILLVCDNTVYVKKLDCLAEIMPGRRPVFPTPGRRSTIFSTLRTPISPVKLLRSSSGSPLFQSRRKNG